MQWRGCTSRTPAVGGLQLLMCSLMCCRAPVAPGDRSSLPDHHALGLEARDRDRGRAVRSTARGVVRSVQSPREGEHGCREFDGAQDAPRTHRRRPCQQCRRAARPKSGGGRCGRCGSGSGAERQEGPARAAVAGHADGGLSHCRYTCPSHHPTLVVLVVPPVSSIAWLC